MYTSKSTVNRMLREIGATADIQTVPLITSEHPVYSDKPWVPYRYILMVLSFFGFMSAFLTRTCLNIALVAMVNYTDTNNQTSDKCTNIPDPPINSTNHMNGEFNWNSHIQSNILAAFFYGYVFTQFPGGYLAEMFGAKYVFGLCVFIPSVLSLLTPVIARSSWVLLVISRVIMGIAEGPLYPSNHALWGVWAPPLERTRAISWSTMGMGVGAVVGQILTGYFCDLSLLGGWPLPFYVFGVFGVVWFIIWVKFAKSSPEDHTTLTNYERNYITSSLHFESKTRVGSRRPWFNIFFSKSTLAIYVFYLFDGIAYYLLISGIPIYMRVILKFDVSQNGLLNALPNASGLLLAFLVGYIADWMRIKGVSTTATRKIFTIIGEGSLVAFTIGMGFVACNRLAAIVLYSLTISFIGLTNAGPVANPLDIAPRYAGTVMGLANTYGNVGGFVSPIIIGHITNDSANSEAWSIVFFLTAAVYFCSTTAFTLLGTGQEQAWAMEKLDCAHIIHSNAIKVDSDDNLHSE